MDYDSVRNGTGIDGEETETPPDFRVSFVSHRPAFRFEQPSEEEFRRWRGLGIGGADEKHTYFMRDRISGLIKIGMSGDPERRRAQLSASGARDVEILLTLRDGNLEGCYHQHFADLRVAGEWFEPHPDILAEIERLRHPAQPSPESNS